MWHCVAGQVVPFISKECHETLNKAVSYPEDLDPRWQHFTYEVLGVYSMYFFFLISVIPYSLTPWCRVLLEKLTGLQLVKKLPTSHGTRRFITSLTSVHHLSLSWASPMQSIYPHPTAWRSVLILSTHLRLGLPSGSFPPVSPPRPYTPPSPHPYVPHAQPISFFSILSPTQYWVRITNHLAPRYPIHTKNTDLFLEIHEFNIHELKN